MLKTVQLHVRARHAFASPAIPSTIPDTLLHPRDSDLDASDEAARSHEELEEDSPSQDAADDALFADIKAAVKQGASAVMQEVEKIQQMTPPPSTSVHNAALAAMIATRKEGQPLKEILAFYNAMINRSVVPNFKTYTTLVDVLTKREIEVADAVYFYESRINRRRAISPDADVVADQDAIAQLRTETNFSSALTLFQAATTSVRGRIPVTLYVSLMRCCAIHGNIDAAIHVYAHLEKRQDLQPYAVIFRDLIRVYQTANDLQGAREVFEEFKAAAQDGRLGQSDSGTEEMKSWRSGILSVWNEMIEVYFRCGQPASALALLEQMMDSPAAVDFNVGDVPLPASSTFSRVIKGFLVTGDVTSALTWFDRLLMQTEKPVHPYRSLVSPTRPDDLAWTLMIESLITNNMFEDLTRILKVGAQHEGEIPSRTLLDAVKTFTSHCLNDPQLPGPHALAALDQLRAMTQQSMQQWLSWDVLTPPFMSWRMYHSVQQLYIACGALDRAFVTLDEATRCGAASLNDAEARGAISLKDLEYRRAGLRHAVETFTTTVAQKALTSQWTLHDSLRLNDLTRYIGIMSAPEFQAITLSMFVDAPAAVKDSLSYDDWGFLLLMARTLTQIGTITPPISLTDLLGVTARRSILGRLDAWVLRLVSQAVGEKSMSQFIALAGEAGWKGESLKFISGQADWRVVKQNVASLTPSTLAKLQQYPADVICDMSHSRWIDEHLVNGSGITPLIAYGRFERGFAERKYPGPESIAKLIGALGRLGETEKVATLYDAAQPVLASLQNKPDWQAAGWFAVENGMVIALAHSGDVDGAHRHRARILEEGGSPSADAYGALILCVKDTTDDTSNAMALFNEATSRGVVPNIYLYNTAISKLAKARKADHALALFQEMKSRGFRPTSVTYGAVIAACCRVGDAQSAEALFDEMASQPNFKPRVPPYNTMMQLYTHTKPDRERVLHFYNAMLAARVQPTPHTYKVSLALCIERSVSLTIPFAAIDRCLRYD